MYADSPALCILHKLEPDKFYLSVSNLSYTATENTSAMILHWQHCKLFTISQNLSWAPNWFLQLTARFHLVKSDISPALQLKLKIASLIS